MEINEIKKLLYKKNPKAKFLGLKLNTIVYKCIIDEIEINFRIPISDIGDAAFYAEMEAKYLIRWIDEIKNI